MTLEQLLKEIARLNKYVDGLNDDLVKKLDQYQSEYEKELLKLDFDVENGAIKSTTANYNKAQSLNMAKKLSFKDIPQSLFSTYNSLAFLTQDFHKKIGIDITRINYRDLRVLKAAKLNDSTNMLTEGALLDQLVKKELVNIIALNSNYKQAIDRLSKNLLGSGIKDGRLSRYAKTYINTSMQGLTRTIDKEVFEELGLDEGKFIYSGTAGDMKIRPFCKARVGKEFTRKQIDRFPIKNRSGLDPFYSPGGWNCRHRMIPKGLLT